MSQPDSAMSFIKASEIWLPEGETLVFDAGDYGPLAAFADVSSQSQFAHGEGLPGKAWAEGCPIVLDQFDGSYFQRTVAAHEAGLTCAIAIPVFADDALKAVLVVLCGGDAGHIGAIEVWEDRDDRLHLEAGYYGAAEDFGTASQDVVFAHGEGLPGGEAPLPGGLQPPRLWVPRQVRSLPLPADAPGSLGRRVAVERGRGCARCAAVSKCHRRLTERRIRAPRPGAAAEDEDP